ncbi:MAG: competence protein ComEC family protein [Prevotella sp.]|jgi:competence protein ComEC|nr:competence protein ComEC family protein [Prevotella sp.]
MKNPFLKMPFLFFLLSLLVGILIQYFLKIYNWSIAFILVGILAMLISYLIPEDRQFKWRWLFGVGVCLFIIGVGIISTTVRQDKSAYEFSDKKEIVKGVVTDTHQEKSKTTAYKVYLPEKDKQIVCYIQRDSLDNRRISPGEEFLFYGEIQPFRNMGNPDDFDYVRYMYNQGFVGSVYLSARDYQYTGEISESFRYTALRCRQYILDFYQSLGFEEDEYAILSALTLGYKEALTDDLTQSFRTTGTVHVLSLSGLHVGVIYLMISFILSFIRRGSKYYFIKPLLVISLLWAYTFLTGLPISVVRASIMLTVFCIGEVFGRKSYSLHALFITAFFMLLYNPFSLFDVGFQLSFMSVLSILYLQPKASALLKTENKYGKKIWQLFTLSLVAQLGTFPLCLYYFGTFPTYFFITNILVVPLVSLIIYAMGGVLLAKGLSTLLPDFSYYFYYLPVEIVQKLTQLLVSIIHFFERLPYALINDIKISLLDLGLIFLFIISLLLFLIYRKSKALIIGLASVFFLILLHTVDALMLKPDQLTVYNRRGMTDIQWNTESKEYTMSSEDLDKGYRFIKYNGRTVLILSTNLFERKEVKEKLVVDFLVLVKDNAFSLNNLNQIFSIKNVVLESSLSADTRRKLTKECKKLNIPCHDVVFDGAFSMNF